MSSTIKHPPRTNSFLTVPELAQLLHVNEKKIYQLAGEGDLPGTKITGKWIFPRHLIEDWIAENSHGGALSDRLIVAGSDDRLLNHVCNHMAVEHQQSALFSYSPCGTRHGLRMLDTRRADACFINWGTADHSARRHLGLMRAYKNHGSWVIVRCLQRTQGFILSRHFFDRQSFEGQSFEEQSFDNQSSEKQRFENQSSQKQCSQKHYSEQICADNLADARQLLSDSSLKWAYRSADAGATRLLEDICTTHNHNYNDLNLSVASNTERGAAGAVNTGEADITFGTQAAAHEFQLPFIPLENVSIDMVMTRRTYFRSLTQLFFNTLISDNTRSIATRMGGYKLHTRLDVLAAE